MMIYMDTYKQNMHLYIYLREYKEVINVKFMECECFIY